MKPKNIEEQIIDNYKNDENMMILVFAQWCINHDLDPTKVYQNAYPEQDKNTALEQALSLTVPKHEAGHIPNETLIGVLSMFGNDDLAFVVTEEIRKKGIKE
ncbi:MULTISPECIES: hypothetical protein [Bacillaceae]|uniref:YxiS n=1 Tax=Evansella alkalicola TaxID=745819 RepID=A0ABS6JSK1_9BACI|nr:MULTISPECIES: hypothetical protein [Bacillaceae]MBU9721222.1 hypothetical protein [Bacillus alkalicola]